RSVLGERPNRVMEQVAVQKALRSFHMDALVQCADKLAFVPPIEKDSKVGIPAGMPDPGAEIIRQPGNFIAVFSGGLLFPGEQRGAEFGAQFFIAVEGKNPVVRRKGRGT